jgi:hypothetical protein
MPLRDAAITKTRIVISLCMVVDMRDPLTVREIHLLIPINPIRDSRIRITCLTGSISQNKEGITPNSKAGTNTVLPKILPPTHIQGVAPGIFNSKAEICLLI